MGTSLHAGVRGKVPPPTGYAPILRSGTARTIVGRFEEVLRDYPNRPALIGEEEVWSFATLDRQARRFAGLLLEAGVQPGEPVALFPAYSPASIAAMLGIARSGGAWMPLDPHGSPALLESQLRVSGARFALIDATHRGLVESPLLQNCRPLVFPDDLPSAPYEGPWPEVVPEAPLSLMFSSGSTGEPKGIIQTHSSRLHQMAAHIDVLRLSPFDRLSLLHRLQFAASSSDVLGCLLTGAALCFYDVEAQGFHGLAGWLNRQQVTVVNWLPSAFRIFMRQLHPEVRLETLRLLILGSEPTLDTDFLMFQRHCCPGAAFVNRLGSAEAGNYAFFVLRPGDPLSPGPVPAGYSPPGWAVELIDDQGNAVPAGSPGEIVVRSPYLSPGYWNRPDLTAAVFLPEGKHETRGIRSGDLGMRAEDGCLHHLGRIGSSTRIAGRWVHLAEIERALHELPGVMEGAAVIARDQTGEPYLAAYLVASPEQAPLTVDHLRRALCHSLPEHMVPSRFVLLPRLPRTHTGKIDRTALPPPGNERPHLQVPYEPPATPLEEELARIWCEVLEVSPVGRRDAFADLGGNSLRALQVVVRIADRWGASLSTAQFLACVDLAGTAETLLTTLAGDDLLAALLNEVEASGDS